MPVVVLFPPPARLPVTRVPAPNALPPIEGGREWIADELRRLGPLSRGERATPTVFAATVPGLPGRRWRGRVD